MRNSKPSCRYILVVEDEVLIRFCTVIELQDAGLAVLEASDAEEGLQTFDENPGIAIVFTDINMPGAFDGLSLAYKIFDRRPSVRLIITSGREEPKRSAMPVGARFLPKPYDHWSLTSLILAT